MIYFIVYVGILAYIRKRDGAFIHLLVMIIILIAIANDTLYYARMADTTPWLSYSIFSFILAQAVIVSYRYDRIAERNNFLVAQLSSV